MRGPSLLSLLLLPGLLAAGACSSASPDPNGAATSADTAAGDPGATTPLSDEPARVVYQVLVRSFWDGSPTGDGTGDLQGLRAKLDYLYDLGVDALMLMPVYKNTGGMGYIPVDLFDVDPAYGTKDDLAALISAAHARNIRVILDSPVNHIGDSSAWFQRARQKDCEGGSNASPYCRYFFFTRDAATTSPFKNWHKPWDWDRTTSADVFQKAWAFDPGRDRDEQYYATFSPQMPDLAFWNFDANDWNTPVVDEMKRFFSSWASIGADGFRIDAAKHLVEGPTSNAPPSTPHNLELLRGFLANVRKTRAGASFIAEVYSGVDEIETYLPDATDMVLDFPFMYAIRDGLDWGGNNADPVRQVLSHYEATQDRLARGHRLVFAGNHDVPRLWTQFAGNLDKIRMAHFMTMLAPESPSLFYGEEVGMEGIVKRADPHANPPILEDVVDTTRAFPWDGDSPAVGFPGGATPSQQPPDNYRQNNLKAMAADPHSLFSYVKSLVALRKSFPITSRTKLHVSTSLYGAMVGYTLVTPPADASQPVRCRSVVVNMSNGGPWSIPVQHTGTECANSGRASVREAYRESSTSAGGTGDAPLYAIGPYGKVVVDSP
jgi:glycosidase